MDRSPEMTMNKLDYCHSLLYGAPWWPSTRCKRPRTTQVAFYWQQTVAMMSSCCFASSTCCQCVNTSYTRRLCCTTYFNEHHVQHVATRPTLSAASPSRDQPPTSLDAHSVMLHLSSGTVCLPADILLCKYEWNCNRHLKTFFIPPDWLFLHCHCSCACDALHCDYYYFIITNNSPFSHNLHDSMHITINTTATSRHNMQKAHGYSTGWPKKRDHFFNAHICQTPSSNYMISADEKLVKHVMI